VLARFDAFALIGNDPAAVEVEANVATGLPRTMLVGLPETAVRESIHRIERGLDKLARIAHKSFFGCLAYQNQTNE
jgi:magnesium chelatase family protein